MKIVRLLIPCLVLSLSLWTLKLFTTELCEHADGRGCCLILRTAPALHNRVGEIELTAPPAEHIHLKCPECMGNYAGYDTYRWLVNYGYVASSAASALLLTMAFRKRRQ